jgi:hypothetical protein
MDSRLPSLDPMQRLNRLFVAFAILNLQHNQPTGAD